MSVLFCEADVKTNANLCQEECEADVKINAKPMSRYCEADVKTCASNLVLKQITDTHQICYSIICEAYVRKNAKPMSR